jgi:hypothetical protein
MNYSVFAEIPVRPLNYGAYLLNPHVLAVFRNISYLNYTLMITGSNWFDFHASWYWFGLTLFKLP